MLLKEPPVWRHETKLRRAPGIQPSPKNQQLACRNWERQQKRPHNPKVVGLNTCDTKQQKITMTMISTDLYLLCWSIYTSKIVIQGRRAGQRNKTPKIPTTMKSHYSQNWPSPCTVQQHKRTLCRLFASPAVNDVEIQWTGVSDHASKPNVLAASYI